MSQKQKCEVKMNISKAAKPSIFFLTQLVALKNFRISQPGLEYFGGTHFRGYKISQNFTNFKSIAKFYAHEVALF